MKSARLASLIVCCLLLTPALVHAQQTSDEQTGQAEQAEQNDQESAEESEAERPDIDSQPIQRAEGEAPGRFIPSEQISQDLGVSFPVDI